MHALRIVLIEDNRETAKMIEDFLHTNFKMAETIVYSSGEEAIEKTKNYAGIIYHRLLS